MILLIMLIPMQLFKGWALQLLYTWYLVPLGLPEITVSQAIGMGLLLYLPNVKGSFKKGEAISSADQAYGIVTTVLMILLVLGIGWLFK